MKIKKMYLKSNTRQENFRTFEERDILNGIFKVGLAARGENIPAWDGTSSKKPLCPLMHSWRRQGKYIAKSGKNNYAQIYITK